MRWQGRRESNNVEDRRGNASGGGGFRPPIRGKGGVAILIIVLVAGYYGVDLTPLLMAVIHCHKPRRRPVLLKLSVRKMTNMLNSPRSSWPILKIPGNLSSRRWAGLIRIQNWSCTVVQPRPVVVPVSRSWGRFIARQIAPSISISLSMKI